MNTNSFDRAVNFLQGALNAATHSANKGVKPDAPGAAESQNSTEQDSILPGFEPPPATPSLPNENDTPKATAGGDPFTPPSEAIAPPLPGFVTASAPPPPQTSALLPGKATKLELHPPAKRRAALAASQAQHATQKPKIHIDKTTALAALSGFLGISLIVALICLASSPAEPAEKAQNDIPLALLPDSADPSLWTTVSSMSGEIDNTILTFERGMATDANGIVYKLHLDFCRNGADIYAKVSGGRNAYVVRLDDTGKIKKAYPAPKNNKPLKEIFGK